MKLSKFRPAPGWATPATPFLVAGIYLILKEIELRKEVADRKKLENQQTPVFEK